MINAIFAKKKAMDEQNSFKEKSDNKDLQKEIKETSAGMRQYGVYSGIVFQMLATMGLSFWGGKKLNDHFEIQNNLLTIGIGFLGMGLAFYNLLKQLKNVQDNEKK